MRLRLRPRTIRTQLLALLLVPMVSLAALWTYGSYTTLRGALTLIRVNATDQYYGTPADDLTQALQRERRAAVEFDASNGAHGGPTLLVAERVTDANAQLLAEHLHRHAKGTEFDPDQNAKVADVLSVLDQLPSLRAAVKTRNTNWSDILDQYSAVIDPEFRLRGSLTELETGQVARKGSVVIELGRARELLSQEDAMVLGGREAVGMTDGQYRDLIGTIDGRQLLHEIYEPELPVADAVKLEDFENGSVGWSLFALEEAARAATAPTATEALPAGMWQRTVDAALSELGSIDQDAEANVDAQAHATGMRVLGKSGAVLLAGLLAMLASLFISLRIGRRIATRLTGLRDTAEELSGRRLPEMMRRLREGDPVDDVAAEAWPHNPRRPGGDLAHGFGDDEIGQVGRAFGVAQRAAVQAAVEQARLRRGVAAVFTTMARRSQVQLHRQLALLDRMERRNQDPVELADLFRLDHMTNRMRRHAESLLILSGLTPGRAWRRPVRMAEVVGAAVGEVDGYERIVVRPMPAMALLGTAIADVVHLLAELLENATSFSPPDTEVEVRGEEVAAGLILSIEDRGLGMNADHLAEANQGILEAAERATDVGAETIDLPETDRLGLFTVGRLAARQNIRVTLRRSGHGGTVAVVFVPHAMLSEPEDPEPAVDEGAAKEASAAGTLVPEVPWVARPVRTPQPSVLDAMTTSAGLPRRVPSRGAAPRLGEEAVSHGRASVRETAPAAAGRERSPEAARSVAAAYARGLARGRSDSAVAQERDQATAGIVETSEVTAEETEHGESAPENAIEKALAGEKATQEDGGPTS